MFYGLGLVGYPSGMTCPLCIKKISELYRHSLVDSMGQGIEFVC